MNFGASLKRALVTYRRALLSADGPAVDTARDVISNGSGGHGKHGQTTRAHAFRELPLPVEMEVSLDRWCQVWEAKLEAAQPNAARAKHGAARQAEDRAILDAVGMDPIDLAFLWRRSTEAICQLRRRRGRDPQTGEYLTGPRPITAPARETLKHHESAPQHHEEE